MTIASPSAKRSRKEVISEWRQSEVLDAARRVFARVGYAAASVDDIAREAGMAKGTLYLYFRSKEEVYVAALTRDMVQLHAEATAAAEASGSFAAALRMLLQLRLDYVRKNQDFLRIYLAEFGRRFTRPKPLSKELEDLHSRSIGSLRELLEQAIVRGEVRPIPPEEAAMTILDVARGLTERHMQGRARLSPEQDLEFTFDFIWNGLQPLNRPQGASER